MFKITPKTRRRFKIDNARIVGIKANGIPRTMGTIRGIRAYDPQIDARKTDRVKPVYQSRIAVGLAGDGKPLDVDRLNSIHGLRVGREWHIQIDATGSLWVNFDPRSIHTDHRVQSNSVKIGYVTPDRRFRRNTRIPAADQLAVAHRMFGDRNALDKVWQAAAAAAAAYDGKLSPSTEGSPRAKTKVLTLPLKPKPDPPRLRVKPSRPKPPQA